MYGTVLSYQQWHFRVLFICLLEAQQAWPLKETKVKYQFERQLFIQKLLKQEVCFQDDSYLCSITEPYSILHHCWTHRVGSQTMSSFGKETEFKKGEVLEGLGGSVG